MFALILHRKVQHPCILQQKRAVEGAAPAAAVAKLNYGLIKGSSQKLNKGVPIQLHRTKDSCLGHSKS